MIFQCLYKNKNVFLVTQVGYCIWEGNVFLQTSSCVMVVINVNVRPNKIPVVLNSDFTM